MKSEIMQFPALESGDVAQPQPSQFALLKGTGHLEYASAIDDQDDRDLGAFRPGVFYFRQGLREAETLGRAVGMGLAICTELERLKAWIIEQGMMPPKWCGAPAEAAEKGWGVEEVRHA